MVTFFFFAQEDLNAFNCGRCGIFFVFFPREGGVGTHILPTHLWTFLLWQCWGRGGGEVTNSNICMFDNTGTIRSCQKFLVTHQRRQLVSLLGETSDPEERRQIQKSIINCGSEETLYSELEWPSDKTNNAGEVSDEDSSWRHLCLHCVRGISCLLCTGTDFLDRNTSCRYSKCFRISFGLPIKMSLFPSEAG